MKKTIILAMILVLLVSLLCGCTNNTANYQVLNSLSSQEYQQVVVKIVSKLDVELTASIFVTVEGDKTKVQYTYQQLSTFDTENTPSSFITNKSGNIVIQGGKIVEQNGEPADENYIALATNGFSFSPAYFTNVRFISGQSNVFTATVTNPTSFTGNPNLVCTNMQVMISYSQKLQQIQLTYTSANQGEVSITYNFS
ncbi:MAG: hypothetical protein IJF66_06020 [Clostridia bacterium]|nr:hypothetical protein [Clostridia bacterium]